MNSDFKDALSALNEAGVRFLVVGGYAVIHYSEPRFTKGLDIWIEPSVSNAARLAKAFRIFGLPMIEVSEADFAHPGTQFLVGVPPNSIDFITTCADLDFGPSWERRTMVDVGGLGVPYLSEEDLIAGKEHLGRDQDRIDVKKLREGKRKPFE